MHSSHILIGMGMTLLATSVLAGYHEHVHGHGGHHDYYAPAKYAYNYGVADKSTGDFKRAYEVREGDITHGSYSFLQPDGVLRTVKYSVGPKSGFRAEVINSGVATHPKLHGFGKSDY